MKSLNATLETRCGPGGTESIQRALNAIDGLLADARRRNPESEYFSEFGVELRRLHAGIRIAHAADVLTSDDLGGTPIPPELVSDLTRLRGEHRMLLGMLDRLIRAVDLMSDLTLEDKDVFFLRVRELLAILRRHEAEENRLVYVAVWSDTGGES